MYKVLINQSLRFGWSLRHMGGALVTCQYFLFKTAQYTAFKAYI